MKQTEYLEGVLNYYRECDITPGVPPRVVGKMLTHLTRGEWAKALFPFCMSTTSSTTFGNRRNWASVTSFPLMPPKFFSHRTVGLKVGLNCATFLKDITRQFSRRVESKGVSPVLKISWVFTTQTTPNKIGRKQEALVGQMHKKHRERKVSESMIQRSGSKNCFDSERGRRAVAVTNAQVWECLITRKRSTPSGLAKFQRNRNIDIKLRKRIK